MGIQSGIVYSNVLLGGTITTFALGLFGNEIYFIVLTVIGAISYFLCKIFLDPLPSSQEQQSEEEISESTSFYNELCKVLKFYPIMKFILPAMILDGTMLGFTATNFSNLLPH